MLIARLVAALTMMLGVGGCANISPFHCDRDSSCGDQEGVCEAEGFCSFPDSKCESGRRFEKSAGALALTCVEENLCGAQNQSCCNGDSCNEGECIADQCVVCGELGQACCAGACQGNAYCSADTCTQCVVEIATGRRHSCVVKQGEVWCFGQNDVGQLGNGETGDPSATPVQVQAMAQPITDVSGVAAGWEHSCAMRDGGSVWCWGNGEKGQLGNGVDLSSTSAVQVLRSDDATPLTDIVELSLGDESSCGVDANGLAWCWGRNTGGALGDGGTEDRNLAAQVLIAADTPLSNVVSMDSGASHHCAHQSDNTLWCWGGNNAGQVGNDTEEDQLFAVAIREVSTFDLGRRHSCAVDPDESLWCWGEGWRGRLGGGDRTGSSQRVPAPVLDAIDGSPFLASSVAAGGVSCALGSDSQVYCWGNNQYGQTGSGAGSYTPVPVLRQDGTPFLGAERLVASYNRVCAHMTDGGVMCWGRNSEGQLGDGTMVNRGYPTELIVSCP